MRILLAKKTPKCYYVKSKYCEVFYEQRNHF